MLSRIFKITKILFLGKENAFLGIFRCFWERFWDNVFTLKSIRRCAMRKKGYKGRCEKKNLNKCEDICRTYDNIQSVYADILTECDDVIEIKCNVLLEGLDIGEYTTDFVCVKSAGGLMVRECVFRKYLLKPMTVKILDASREYWLRHGVEDWGLVIDGEK